MSLKIGILTTCIGAEKIYQNHLSDGEQIASLLKSVRPNWSFDIYRAYIKEFPNQMESCDGYVIGGSPASVNAQDEWVSETLNYIRKLYTNRRPMFGICFGHQAIAKALGGRVESSQNGWALGSVKVYFSDHATWMTNRRDIMRLYAIHNEQVVVPPNGADVLGQTDTCPIASFRIDNHIFTTQHHPEMTAEFMEGVVDHMERYMDKEIILKVKDSLKFGADNIHFAEWIASFLEVKAKFS